MDDQIKKLYAEGVPVNEIAKRLKRHPSTIKNKASALGIKHPNRFNLHGRIELDSSSQGGNLMAQVPKDKLPELVHAERQAHSAKQKGSLAERKYRALLRDYERLETEVEALTQVAQYSPNKYAIKPRKSDKRNNAVPFIVLSDWHVEEEVKPRTVGGKNRFTLAIARKRAERCFQNALNLIEEKARDVEITDVAVFLIGDFITGNIHEENVENAQLGPVPAIHFAQDLLESGLQFLLDNTPYNISCYCKVGNHSRITARVRASTEADNALETAMFVGMARNFREEERIRFHIEPSYYSIVKINGLKIRYHHGHAVSYGGGIGGLHIPLRKAIKSWNETEHADFDIMGHYHSFLEHTTMKYMVNGSLIGYSAYAERVKAVIEPPVQGFGLIHSRYGVIALSPIFVE